MTLAFRARGIPRSSDVIPAGLESYVYVNATGKPRDNYFRIVIFRDIVGLVNRMVRLYLVHRPIGLAGGLCLAARKRRMAGLCVL